MNNSKVAIAVSRTVSLIQIVFGGFITIFFGLCIIVYLFDAEYRISAGVAFLVVCLLFVALGILLIRSSRKKSKLIKEFQKYVTAISRDASGYIPNIAASIGTSEDAFRNNLDLMIKKKFFFNAYIDRNSNCIRIASKQSAQNITPASSNVSATPAYAGSQAATMVTIKCQGCGGINTIANGQINKCDYCGSAIKYE